MRESCRKGWRNATVVFLLLGFVACASPARERREFQAVRMGVRCRVLLYAETAGAAEEGARAAFEEIARLEDVFSDYRATSEAARLSAAAGAGPREVSGELFEVADVARAISEASDGAFDITIGPMTQLWRAARDEGRTPQFEEWERARAAVGFRNLVFGGGARTLELKKPGMSLDFGAIAKGYACDRAVELLRSRGFAECLVSLAGDAAAGDPPPGEPGWKFALESCYVVISLCSISTSGSSEQSLRVSGVDTTVLSHILDPKRPGGAPPGRAVTVVARRGAIADGLATALTLVKPERAEALVAGFGAAALLFDAQSPTLRPRTLGAFPEIFEFPAPEHQ